MRTHHVRDDISVCFTECHVHVVSDVQSVSLWLGWHVLCTWLLWRQSSRPTSPPPSTLTTSCTLHSFTPSHSYTGTHTHTLPPITISLSLKARQTFHLKGPSKSLQYHSSSSSCFHIQALLEAALHRVSPHSLPSHALVDERYLKTGQVSSLQHHLLTTYTTSCPGSVWLM